MGDAGEIHRRMVQKKKLVKEARREGEGKEEREKRIVEISLPLGTSL